MKRARDRDAIEDYLEEYAGRLREFNAEEEENAQPGDIAMVATGGPPWHDSKTGKELDPKKVAIGMDKEQGSMDSFGVHID
eukprot:8545667-Heterocapsa_arctica.AAC.1